MRKKEELASKPREFLFLKRPVRLAQVVAEVGHADQQQHRQIDRSENQTKRPELLSAYIAAAVIDRAWTSGIRGDDSHQAKRVAEQQRDQLDRHSWHRDG